MGVRYDEALAYATKMHEGALRREGIPYITHPVAVAEMLAEWGMDEDFQIAGLFHDLLEDTDASEEEIRRIGGEKVLRCVRLLTKFPGYVKPEYVGAIRSDPMAKTVKTADRVHNLMTAVNTDEAFRRHYIKDTVEWYIDFSPLIVQQVRSLMETLPGEQWDFSENEKALLGL